MSSPSPPRSPPPTNPTFYFSPHSPTQLRFPPSSHFSEWRGRCFKCCRTGHNAAACRNPMICGKYWGEGHMGTKCTAKTLNPAAMPYWRNNGRGPQSQATHTSPVEELLKPNPMAAQTFPNNRPKRLAYHLSRDSATKSELLKLTSGVVFNTNGHEDGFSLKDILGFPLRTKVVKAEEISIAQLGKERFLIILPHGMAPETFIAETTPELWDAGFTFQPWSEIDGAHLSLPEYKVLLDLHDIPPHLFREHQVKQVVSTFGVFLASAPPNDLSDLSVWSAVVAVRRLEDVPEELVMHDLGSEHIIPVKPKNWCRSPLYKAFDLPKIPPKFPKPQRKAPAGQPREPEHFSVSRRALMKICKDIQLSALPEEVRAILEGSSSSTTIPFPQVEAMVFAPLLADSMPPSTGQNPETGHSTHMHPSPTQFTIEEQPLTISAGITDGTHNHEAGNSSTITSNPPVSTKPQRIPSPIRILKRTPNSAGTEKNAGILSLDSSVPDVVIRKVPGQEATRQRKEKPKAPIPTPRPRGANTSNADKGKKTVKPSGPAQKARKGVPVLIPPKPVLFKKIAQKKFTEGPKQQRSKHAVNKAAEIITGPDGFFEVAVEYGLCKDLAERLGLKVQDVTNMLQVDNQERKAAPQPEMATRDVEMDEEGLDLEFNSDEDLGKA